MFLKAVPIYPKGHSEELNTYAAFRTVTGSLQGAELHVTAANFYQATVNGVFVAFGPARTAKGYARKDVLSLDEFRGESNEIIITVAGYGCRSLSTVRQPAFLQAEIRRGDHVIGATGQDFEVYLSSRRVQKVQRYSMQRHFSEVWDFHQPLLTEKTEWDVLPTPLTILDRVAPYPHYEKKDLSWATSVGTLELDESIPYTEKKYSSGIDEFWGGYLNDEIPYKPFVHIQRQKQILRAGKTPLPLSLNKNEYAIFDFGCIETGFLRLSASVSSDAQVLIAFSEGGRADHFEFTKINSHNAVEFLFPEGNAHGMTFEPYTVKYALVAVTEGSLTLTDLGITTFEASTAEICVPPTGDPDLDSICRGAVRTYAHNAVDLYSDCPSRERAGWLCDSYFTAKTEYALYGRVPVEEAFLENYRLYRNEPDTLPEGAIPMCYPSDIPANKNFIPQWTMWYILEVEEYLTVRSPETDREIFRASVEGLLGFYRRYENSDGLLERLPAWNFVEWSDANKWTWDVNYPTNFLYARVLDAAASLYGDESLHRKADRVRAEAIRQSFDGELFADHAVRDESGKLIRQDHYSEAGQYYAILFGGFDLDAPEYAKLNHLVHHVFGATRTEHLPNVVEINAFIGVYLRLEVLLKRKEYDLLLRDVKDFFGAMEKETGTLWEHRNGTGSRDHGFASYALVAIRTALENK